ncbi:MAG: cobalamin B12-binding domain-containing protein [Phycisphaeraceae bacterium]|nr:cobalamin B12-binding domain-containing protein [Phycisphaeraceae bacterium]
MPATDPARSIAKQVPEDIYRQTLIADFTRLLQGVEPGAAAQYAASRSAMIEMVDQAMLTRDDLPELLGRNPVQVMLDDHRAHAMFMQSVFALRSPRTFVQTVTWVYRTYLRHGFSEAYFDHKLRAWVAAIRRHIQPVTPAEGLLAFYQAMIDSRARFVQLAEQATPTAFDDGSGGRYISRLTSRLLAGDEKGASEMVRTQLHVARDLPHWWDRIVAPALYTVGQLWSDGHITVADEHIASAIASRIMTQCLPRPLDRNPRGPRAVIAIPPGEEHHLGASMVRDLLTMLDCPCSYTGPNTPIDAMVDLVHRRQPELLLLSVTMFFNLESVREIIERVRMLRLAAQPRIILGGQALNHDPDLWKQLGADDYASSLHDLLDRLPSARQLLAAS